jgi:RimJ/RimL family protein N-acetyltransferase
LSISLSDLGTIHDPSIYPDYLLRAALPSDAETIARWLNDPELTKFMSHEPVSVQSVVEAIEKATLASGELWYMIVAHGQVVGHITMNKINLGNRRAEVGRSVIAPEAPRGRGYCTMSTHLLFVLAFERLGLHRMSSVVAEENKAVVKCAINIGYRYAGRLRDMVAKGDRYLSWLVFDLLQDEWWPIRQELERGRG